MALTFDDLAASTLKKYRKQFTDNVFDTHPLLYWLKEKKRVRFLDGGTKIVEPLIHTEGDTAGTGSYSGYDAIEITPVETATAAEFDWKQIKTTIAISGEEELKNNGEAAQASLLEAKILQAEETLKNSISTMVFKDTAPGNGGKDITGIGVLIGDEDSAVTVVGGIDCDAMDGSGDFWRAHVVDKTGVAFADVDIRKFVRNAYNTASKGGPDKVDVCFTEQLIWENYEEDLLPTVRRVHQATADAGFANLEINGVPLMWDWQCPAGTIYGINSKYLGMVGHSQRWFKQTPFTSGLQGNMSAADGGVATTVDARYSVITSMLELTVRNRRRHFRIKNIATS